MNACSSSDQKGHIKINQDSSADQNDKDVVKHNYIVNNVFASDNYEVNISQSHISQLKQNRN